MQPGNVSLWRCLAPRGGHASAPSLSLRCLALQTRPCFRERRPEGQGCWGVLGRDTDSRSGEIKRLLLEAAKLSDTLYGSPIGYLQIPIFLRAGPLPL